MGGGTSCCQRPRARRKGVLGSGARAPSPRHMMHPGEHNRLQDETVKKEKEEEEEEKGRREGGGGGKHGRTSASWGTP